MMISLLLRMLLAVKMSALKQRGTVISSRTYRVQGLKKSGEAVTTMSLVEGGSRQGAFSSVANEFNPTVEFRSKLRSWKGEKVLSVSTVAVALVTVSLLAYVAIHIRLTLFLVGHPNRLLSARETELFSKAAPGAKRVSDQDVMLEIKLELEFDRESLRG